MVKVRKVNLYFIGSLTLTDSARMLIFIWFSSNFGIYLITHDNLNKTEPRSTQKKKEQVEPQKIMKVKIPTKELTHTYTRICERK